MSVISLLLVNLKANTADFDNKLKGSSKHLTGFQRTAKNVSASVVSAFAKMAAAAGGLAVLRGAINQVDELGKVAAQVGMPVEQLQAFYYAASQNDTAVTTLNSSLIKLQKSIGDAARGTGEAVTAFQELGLDVNELSQMPIGAAWVRISDALNSVDNTARRSSLGMKIFTEEFRQVDPLVRAGGDAVASAAQYLKDMGLTMSSNTVESVKEFKASLDSVKMVTTAALAEALSPFLDELTRAAVTVGYVIPKVAQFVDAHRELIKTLILGYGALKIYNATVLISARISMSKPFVDAAAAVKDYNRTLAEATKLRKAYSEVSANVAKAVHNNPAIQAAATEAALKGELAAAWSVGKAHEQVAASTNKAAASVAGLNSVIENTTSKNKRWAYEVQRASTQYTTLSVTSTKAATSNGILASMQQLATKEIKAGKAATYAYSTACATATATSRAVGAAALWTGTAIKSTITSVARMVPGLLIIIGIVWAIQRALEWLFSSQESLDDVTKNITEDMEKFTKQVMDSIDAALKAAEEEEKKRKALEENNKELNEGNKNLEKAANIVEKYRTEWKKAREGSNVQWDLTQLHLLDSKWSKAAAAVRWYVSETERLQAAKRHMEDYYNTIKEATDETVRLTSTTIEYTLAKKAAEGYNAAELFELKGILTENERLRKAKDAVTVAQRNLNETVEEGRRLEEQAAKDAKRQVDEKIKLARQMNLEANPVRKYQYEKAKLDELKEYGLSDMAYNLSLDNLISNIGLGTQPKQKEITSTRGGMLQYAMMGGNVDEAKVDRKQMIRLLEELVRIEDRDRGRFQFN